METKCTAITSIVRVPYTTTECQATLAILMNELQVSKLLMWPIAIALLAAEALRVWRGVHEQQDQEEEEDSFLFCRKDI